MRTIFFLLLFQALCFGQGLRSPAFVGSIKTPVAEGSFPIPAVQSVVHGASGGAAHIEVMSNAQGANRLRIAFTASQLATPTISVFDGETAMTLLDSIRYINPYYIRVFYLVNPPTGSTTIHYTNETGAAYSTISVVVVTNAAQTNPFGTVTGTLFGTYTGNHSVESSADWLNLACGAIYLGDVTATCTYGEDQTQVDLISGGDYYFVMSVSSQPGAATSVTDTFAWTATGSSSGIISFGVKR